MDPESIKDDGDIETPDTEEEEAPEKANNELEEKDDEKAKSRKSAIAQKKFWREKAKSSSSKVQELETELTELKKGVKTPEDEKEKAAQEYIRRQARSVYEELQTERERAKNKELSEFEDKVQTVLEDNPDIPEEELLEVIEEYEVEPKVALKILKRTGRLLVKG